MPRKGHVQKREILPDPMYNSKLVTSLIDHCRLLKTPSRSFVNDFNKHLEHTIAFRKASNFIE